MPHLLVAAAGLWVGGVSAFSVSAGYYLAPYVHGARRTYSQRATTVQCKEPPPAPDPTDGRIELIRPPDAGALRSDSESRRLAPVRPLKRKRRSRKIRTKEIDEGKFVPLVPGARQSTSESIIAAYNSDDNAVKQTQGEDYWVDPSLLQAELEAKKQVSERSKKCASPPQAPEPSRAQASLPGTRELLSANCAPPACRFRRKKGAFSADRLKDEIAAPYKNNVIGGVVAGIGLIALAYLFMPGLFENIAIEGVATFPTDL